MSKVLYKDIFQENTDTTNINIKNKIFNGY